MKTSVTSRVFDTFNVIFFVLIGLLTLYPFWHVLMSSVMGAEEYYRKALIIWAEAPSLIAYRFILSTSWIQYGFRNSVVVTVCGTVYSMTLVATAAFAMTKKRFPGRRFFQFYYLVPMYFSGGVVPFYLVVTKYLGMGNSLRSLIFTSGLSIWNYLVMTTFFKEIPDSLGESARIDGAGEFKILWNIVLPLSMPVLATLTLFTVVDFWNEWYRALIFISNENLYPLPMILRKLIIDSGNVGGDASAKLMMERAYVNMVGGNVVIFDVAIKCATVMVAALPVIAVYPFLQKYFAKGVLIGSLKE